MQREANVLVESLRDFILQPDYPTLVLGAADSETALVNRVLSDLDRQDEQAFYLVFSGPCVNALAYLDEIVASLLLQLEICNTELAARQEPPLPPLPLQVQDKRYPPAQRLAAAIEHCGEHVPTPDTIVWGLMPSEVGDMQGYEALVQPLLADKGVEPWMERHRFIVRDPQALLIPKLHEAKNEHTLVMELDFSNDRVEQSLLADAADKSLPSDQRVLSFFQLGALDFAFKRYPDALSKYATCFSYYFKQGNSAMQSLCLKCAGDTAKQADRPTDALRFYQQGIAVALEGGSAAALQQALYAAGCTCLELDRNQEAAGYLEHASALAGKLNDPYTKCDAMEKHGQALWRCGKDKEAEQTWLDGKGLAQQFGYRDRVLSILDLLITMYNLSNQPRRGKEIEREKRTLERGAQVPA